MVRPETGQAGHGLHPSPLHRGVLEEPAGHRAGPQCRPDSLDGHLRHFQSALATLRLSKDVQIDPRFAGVRSLAGRISGSGAVSVRQLEAYAADLVQRSVDIIVTVGTPATFAASHATTSIPIVMLGVSDPVRATRFSGRVDSDGPECRHPVEPSQCWCRHGHR
jgi:hypothetical protein